jgi:WD40 repeat protein
MHQPIVPRFNGSALQRFNLFFIALPHMSKLLVCLAMHALTSRSMLRLAFAAIALQTAHGAELYNGQTRLLQASGKPVSALAFSKDGLWLASGSQTGTVSIWMIHLPPDLPSLATPENLSRPERLERTLSVHTGKVAALAFSPDGKLIASGGQDRSLRIWTVEGQQLRKLDGHTNGISALAFSPDGRILASGGTDGSVFLWNTRDWTLAHRLPGHRSCVHALCVSANNQFLASGSDDYLRIWNLEDGRYTFDTLREPVRALSYHDPNVAPSANNEPIFESSDGRSIMGWQPSVVVGSHIFAPWKYHDGVRWQESQAAPQAVAAESSLMASGGTNGTVEIWDANGYGTVRQVAHAGAVESLAFSPVALLLASGSEDGTIKLWQSREIMNQADSRAYPIPSLDLK